VSGVKLDEAVLYCAEKRYDGHQRKLIVIQEYEREGSLLPQLFNVLNRPLNHFRRSQLSLPNADEEAGGYAGSST
jgi:hypothetical protein